MAPLKLEIRVADATEIAGVPALVVPANRQLTLGWGSHLAEKVLALAGREVEAEALAAHPKGIALGEAVLTRAGRVANFTHLIHAAVLDKYDFNPLFLLRLRERTSETTLRAATAAALRLAHEAGLAGLVFTPMGAGIGGMRMEKCARIMVEAMQRFACEHSDSPLREALIACRSERAAAVFRHAVERCKPV